MNVNILSISELKWTGMGEFNSDDHYIYYCGQEFLRSNSLGLTFASTSYLLEWVNLTQIIIISTTVGENPLEDME